MKTSPSCLYDSAVSMHFIIISCSSMHNRKINVLNIFCCYCIFRLIVPLPPILSIEKIISSPWESWDKESHSLLYTKGLFVKLNHQAIWWTLWSHWSFQSLILPFTCCTNCAQTKWSDFSQVLEEKLCRQSGKRWYNARENPSTYFFSAGYPSLTLFSWKRTINVVAPAYIFLGEDDRDCGTLGCWFH